MGVQELGELHQRARVLRDFGHSLRFLRRNIKLGLWACKNGGAVACEQLIADKKRKTRPDAATEDIHLQNYSKEDSVTG